MEEAGVKFNHHHSEHGRIQTLTHTHVQSYTSILSQLEVSIYTVHCIAQGKS